MSGPPWTLTLDAEQRRALRIDPDGRVHFDLFAGEESVPCAFTAKALGAMERLSDLPAEPVRVVFTFGYDARHCIVVTDVRAV